jgi:stage II sporulation protein D
MRRSHRHALALLLAPLLALLFASAFAGRPVRILLDEVVSADVRIDGAHLGYVDGLIRFETPLPLLWSLVAQGGRLLSDGEEIGVGLTLAPVAGVVRWGDRSYRGNLQLRARGDRVMVINVVDLEDYLRGVVPSEMQASWPIEALKAQAVAARTFALSSLDPEGSYDLCATIDCQVYRGMEVEHPRSDRAVAETEGIVVTYGGVTIRAYYHADSGGVVASSAEVWGMPLPYAVAMSDVAASSPHRRWRVELDPQLVAQTLRDSGHEVGDVQAMRVLAFSDSGRVSQLQVLGSGGNVLLDGATVQRMVRRWGLKSARFTLIGALTVQGDGWGHGVGMSQYGARALAQANYSFGQILVFYYPNTDLWRLTFTSDN